MVLPANIQDCGAKLIHQDTTVEEKCRLVLDIKERLEVTYTAEYPNFLRAILKPLLYILASIPPQSANTDVHKLRVTTMQVLSRFPQSETLKPHASEIATACLAVLQQDNQECGLIAVRLYFDLQKAYRSALEGPAEKYLDFVVMVYKGFADTCELLLRPEALAVVTPSFDNFQPACRSFKVMAEIPLTVMVLIQMYQQYIKTHVPVLFPLLIKSCAVRGPDSLALPPPAAQLVNDFKTSQIKTLNFLTVMVRHFQSIIEPEKQLLADCTVHLLRTGPCNPGIRKELLVATRYMVSGAFKACFESKVDEFLGENFLLGTCQKVEPLHGLAVMTLAELLHNVRKTLQPHQLGRVVFTFSHLVADRSLSYSVQCTCVRLMLNLVECIYQTFKRPDADGAAKARARQQLYKILETFVSKLDHLRHQIPKLIAAATAEKDSSNGGDRAAGETILSLSGTVDKEKEVHDCKLIVQNMVYGIKTLLYSILFGAKEQHKALMLLPGAPPPTPSGGMAEEEVRLTARLLLYGLECLKVASYYKEGKEFYDHFGEVFTVLDHRDFVDVFSTGMDSLFLTIVEEPEVIHMATHLMSAKCPVARVFTPLLTQHLIKRLDLLAKPSTLEAQVLQKLFKQVLEGMKNIPDVEPLLAPCLVEAISHCVKAVIREAEPLGYLHLIHLIFSSCQGSSTSGIPKSAMVLEECVPLIKPCLSTFLAMMNGPNSQELKPLLAELCLTIPVHLSALLVYLPRMMRPLVVALQGSNELVLLGLKTLECWVDSLNPEYLEPTMADVVHEIMSTLWGILRPAAGGGAVPPVVTPATTNTKSPALLALQLLGKLGGLNRRFLKDPTKLEYKDNSEHGLRLILTFKPHTSFLVPMDKCVAQAKAGLFSSTPLTSEMPDTFFRQQALKFLQICLASLLNLRSPEDSQLSGSSFDKVAQMLLKNRSAPHVMPTNSRVDLGPKTKQQLMAERQMLGTLIAAAVAAAADPLLSETAVPFMEGVCRHFAMLYTAGAVSPPSPLFLPQPVAGASRESGSSTALMFQGLRELDVNIFLEAVIEVLCDADPGKSQAALSGLRLFLTTIMMFHEAKKQLVTSKAAKLQVAQEEAEGEQVTLERAPQVKLEEGLKEEAAAPPVVKKQEEPATRSRLVGRERSVAAKLGYAEVLDELLPRLRHCCWEDTWHARLGGVLGIGLLVEHLPSDYLSPWLPSLVRALLAVARWLPEHSLVERQLINATLKDLVTKCLSPIPTPQAAPEEVEAQQGRSSGVMEAALEADHPVPSGSADVDNCTRNKEPEAREKVGEASQSGGPAKEHHEKRGAGEGHTFTAAAVGSVDSPTMKQIVELLLSTILHASSNSSMRGTAKLAMQLVASLSKRPMLDWLKSFISAVSPGYHSRSLQPVKTVEQTTCQAEAYAFCLSLSPPPFPLDAAMVHLVRDAMQLVEKDEKDIEAEDKDEASLLGSRINNASQSLDQFQRMKMACLEVLCGVMQWEEFREAEKLQKLRDDLTALFLKTLMSTVEPLHLAAKRGLQSVIKYGKLPKALLQSSLRPILQNLSTHRDLSIPFLHGLQRLLSLLFDWFNLALGEKAIEHLKCWLDPEKLLKGQTSWKPGEEGDVAAEILQLFHLLPRSASKFLETHNEGSQRLGLVVMTIQLEEKLPLLSNPVPYPRTLWSPYRTPLARYLVKYSHEAVEYFLDIHRLQNPSYFNRLLDIIKAKECGPLRDQVAASRQRLADILNLTPSLDQELLPVEVLLNAQLNVVHLIEVLCKLYPDTFLVDDPVLYGLLLQRWRAPGRIMTLEEEEVRPRAQVLQTKRLARCLLNYIGHHEEEVKPLLEVYSCLVVKTSVDLNFVIDFTYDVVGPKFSGTAKKLLLGEFLNIFHSQKVGDDVLTLLLQHLIIPQVQAALDQGQVDCLDEDVVKSMVRAVLRTGDPPLGDAGSHPELGPSHVGVDGGLPRPGGPPCSECLKGQLLQLITVVLMQVPDQLVPYRKELIRLGWDLLKLEESPSRGAAFLMVAHLLKHFAAPEQVTLHVFVLMLRHVQQDTSKNLVKEALDILVAVLQERMPRSEAVLHPVWVKYVKRVLLEEGHIPAALLHLWQVVLRHKDAIFASRSLFFPLLSNSLSRLGMPQNSTADNRKLALDLAGLMIYWEQQRLKEEGSHTGVAHGHKRARPVDGDAGEEADATGECTPPPAKLMRRAADEDVATGQPSRTLSTSPVSTITHEEIAHMGLDQDKMVPLIPDTHMAHPTPGEPAEGGAGDAPGAPVPESEPRPGPALEELILNFLVRMAFVLSDGKDTDSQVNKQLLSQTMQLVKEASHLWPQAAVKMTYVERLLQTQAGQEVMPVLQTGWLVLNLLMDKQPTALVSNCVNQILMLIEPCFALKQPEVVDIMCEALQKVYRAFPLADGDVPATHIREAMAIQTRVEGLLNKYLADGGNNNQPLLVVPGSPSVGASGALLPHAAAPTPVFLGVCCSLSVLGALAEVVPDRYLQSFMLPLVQMLNRCARDITKSASVFLASKKSGMESEPEVKHPQYGTMTWCISQAVQLCAPRVLMNAENKRLLLQTLVLLLTGQGALKADPMLFMLMLRVLENWLLRPEETRGTLTVKEAVLFMQRLAHLDKTELVASIKGSWDKALLGLLRNLCTSPQVPEDLRQEVFQRVERFFLCGLRAQDPDDHRAFFQLYNQHIPVNLYDRLHFVIVGQEWEAMAHQFWLKQALDLILSVLKEEERIMLAPNSAQIPPLLHHTRQNVYSPAAATPNAARANSAGPLGMSPGVKPQGEGTPTASGTQVKDEPGVKREPVLEGSSPDLKPPRMSDGGPAVDQVSHDPGSSSGLDIPPEARASMLQHIKFLEQAGELRVRDMISALRDYATVDPQVVYHVWVLVFPIAWATLEKNQQINLAKPIISLLSKEYHQKQSMARPNVIQALLEGISLSQPQPKIPPELIRYLGKTYNAWHIAIPLLESHVIIFPDEIRCFDALAQLYKLVNEDDIMCGLWRKRCYSESTKVALSLIQHGYWQEAQDVLAESTKASYAGQNAVKRGEAAMWVEQWVNCSKQLNQWDILLEYAQQTDNQLLAMDSLWRLSNWAGLKEVLQSKLQVEETAQVRMIRAYLALQEGDVMAGESCIGQAMQASLTRWWQLPDVGVAPHTQLLQTFQQLIELKESSRILMDLAAANQRPDYTYGDLKDIMDTWRLRTPNEWDSMVHWQDVLVWRNQIYNVVISAFQRLSEVAPQLHQLGYRDKAWSVNKLAYVAYKHSCPDVCINIIGTMYGFNAMEVQEAFVKICEQAKAYLDMTHVNDITAGLNLLNTTNLDYFQPHHQAEIFRLKGLFYQALDDMEAAGTNFSTSLVLWRESPDSWVSWGTFWDQQYQSKPNNELLEYTVHCYLQGLRLGSATARNLIPRLLYLLSFENDSGAVGRQLDAAQGIPLWVWFVWIPQLLTSLARSESPHVKPILAQLCDAYPQALYYGLRNYLLTLRESAMKAMAEYNKAKQMKMEAEAAAAKGAEAVPVEDPQPPAEIAAFEAGKEIMERLRSKHPSLGATLESMLSELGGKFVPKPEERLLAVVTALLHRCYKLPVANIAEIPSSLKKELLGVCKACFTGEGSSRSRTMQKDMREAFVTDLNPDGSHFPKSLGELADRLKAWRNRLQASLEDKYPAVLRLEDECRMLQEINLTGVQMPGQYLEGHEVVSGALVYLEYISSNVVVVRRHSSSFRRLAFHCSNGHVRYMLVQSGQNFNQGATDERIMQLLRQLNLLLDKQPQTRRRLLSWHTPVIIPIWPQARMMEEDPSFCTYGDAYEINCAKHGKELDAPIVTFKKRVASPTGNYKPDPHGELRLKAFNEICEVLTENIFSQYIYKTLPTCNHLWVFKKSFCSHMALSSLLCQMLLVGGRSPNKILFARDTGKVYQMDFMPLYGERGLLERFESVPFRLTRNLLSFFTAFGVEGLFTVVMSTAAAALLQKDTNLHHLLSMFFKEDLLSYTSRRPGRSSASHNIKNEHLRNLVGGNVKRTVERIQQFAPRKPVEGELTQKVINSGAAELVEAATNPLSLSKMDPTWHPWY